MKTKIFLLLFLFAPGINPACAQWQVVHTGGGLNLVDGCFINDSVGFVISSSGVILKTADRGASWVEKVTLTGMYTSICKAGPDTIYAAGNYIYVGTGQGETWSLVRGLGDTIADMIFFDSKHGFAVVRDQYFCIWGGPPGQYLDDYHVYATENGGFAWQNSFGIGEGTSYFQQVDAETAFVFGRTSNVYPHCGTGWYDLSKKTLNRGSTWNTAFLPGPVSFISMLNKDTGYCVKPAWDLTHIWRTDNGTSSFNQYYTDFNDASVNQCLFLNEIDGYLKGSNKIFVTRTNGLTWLSDYISPSPLKSLFHNASQELFGIGSNGLIIKKHIIASPHPDTVYRVNTDKSKLDFGLVNVNSSLVKQLLVTNSGNVPITLTMSTNAPFRLSTDGIAFGNSTTVPANPNQPDTLFVQFAPTATGFSRDTVFITSDSVATLKVPLTGSGYLGLSGIISTDTLICADTVEINGNLKILHGARMVICPGTYVRLLNKYAIDVEGVLEARGDSLHAIRFGVKPPYGSWYGIRFDNPDPGDTSTLSWCILPVPCDSSTIRVMNGDLHMNNCDVSNLSGPGISVMGQNSKLTLSGSRIFNTKEYAIYMNGCGSSSITGGYVYNNSQAIFCSTVGEVTVGGNWIYSNTGDAINCSGKMNIRQNRIFSNVKGISFSGPGVVIENNEIHHHMEQGIHCIFTDSCVVAGNKIFSNGGGVYLAGNYILIENNEIYYNSGLGIFCQAGNKDCFILQNLVFNNGDYYGAYLTNLSSLNTLLYLAGNTFCNHLSSESFGELFAVGSGGSSDLEMQVVNNIFFNLDTAANPIAYSNVSCSIEFNYMSNYSSPGSTNISGIIDFVKPTLKTGIISDSVQYDWSLKETSPAINAGDTITSAWQMPLDFAGNPRVYEGRIDMGAYEYQDSIPKPSAVSEGGSMIKTLVYPNPAKEILNVFADVHSSAVFVLYDISGRQVCRQEFFRTAVISMKGFPIGIYFYEIRGKQGIVANGKIVKE